MPSQALTGTTCMSTLGAGRNAVPMKHVLGRRTHVHVSATMSRFLPADGAIARRLGRSKALKTLTKGSTAVEAPALNLQPNKPVQPLQGEDVEHVQLLLRLSELTAKVEDLRPAQLSEHALQLVTTSATCNANMTYELGSASDDDYAEGDGMALPLAQVQASAEEMAARVEGIQRDWIPATLPSSAAAGGVGSREPGRPGAPTSSALDELNARNDYSTFSGSSSSSKSATVMARVQSLRSQISKTAAAAVAAGKPLASPLTRAASQAATATGKAATATFNAMHEAVAHSLPTAGQLVSATDSYEEFPEEAGVAPVGLDPMSVSAAAVRNLINKSRTTSSAAAAAAAAAAASASGSGALVPEQGTLGYYNTQQGTYPVQGEPTSQWLVADDLEQQMRYIVIEAPQGLVKAGARLASSELVTFESYSLGAKVNVRLYQEAAALYNRFMPLLMDWLEEFPEGKVQLAGVGLGGGLAELLALMLVHRGLRHSSLAPVYGLNSPPVLCEVPDFKQWCSKEGCSFEEVGSMLEDMMTRGVLSELGLSQDAIRNVYFPQPGGGSGSSAGSGRSSPVGGSSVGLGLLAQANLPGVLKSWIKSEGAAGVREGAARNLPLQILNPLGKVLVFGGLKT